MDRLTIDMKKQDNILKSASARLYDFAKRLLSEKQLYTKDGVPCEIYGPGIGRKKAIDIIRSKKVKAQLKNMKVR